jgi:hypothetical protein
MRAADGPDGTDRTGGLNDSEHGGGLDMLGLGARVKALVSPDAGPAEQVGAATDFSLRLVAGMMRRLSPELDEAFDSPTVQQAAERLFGTTSRATSSFMGALLPVLERIPGRPAVQAGAIEAFVTSLNTLMRGTLTLARSVAPAEIDDAPTDGPTLDAEAAAELMRLMVAMANRELAGQPAVGEAAVDPSLTSEVFKALSTSAALGKRLVGESVEKVSAAQAGLRGLKERIGRYLV